MKSAKRSRNSTIYHRNKSMEGKQRARTNKSAQHPWRNQHIALELHVKDSKNKKVKRYVISSQVPCLSYKEDKYKVTLQQLQSLIKKKTKNCTLIIGLEKNNSDHIPGNFRNLHKNATGNTLRQFLCLNNLAATGTFFKKKTTTIPSPLQEKVQPLPNRSYTHRMLTPTEPY